MGPRSASAAALRHMAAPVRQDLAEMLWSPRSEPPRPKGRFGSGSNHGIIPYALRLPEPVESVNHYFIELPQKPDELAAMKSLRIERARSRRSHARRSLSSPLQQQQPAELDQANVEQHDEGQELLSYDEKRLKARNQMINIEAQEMRQREQYVELEFELEAAGTYSTREELAAKAFDKRHVARSRATERELAQLKYDPTSISGQRRVKIGCSLVRRNKYVLAEKHNPFAAARKGKVKPKVRKRWTLESSIWVGRRDYGNSLDFFETDEALRGMFDVDWRTAKAHHGLAQLIVKALTCTP